MLLTILLIRTHYHKFMKMYSTFLLLILFCNFISIAYAGEWATTTIGTPSEYDAVDSSMALDNDGNLHIGYRDISFNLRYATNSGGIWKTIVLDDGGTDTSLAIDSNGKVHISYYAQTTGIKYATNASGSWVVTIVESDVIKKPATGKTSGIVLDSLGNVHIWYTDFANDTDALIKHATNASGDWQTDLVDNGWVRAIVIDSSDTIHIVYNDSYYIKYAEYSDDHWQTSELNITGAYPSLAIDSSRHLIMQQM
jgi:hypothetical protein